MTKVGTGAVAGAAATQYLLTVDVTKLPDTFPGKSGLVSTGYIMIPITLWVDAQKRPVKVTEHITAAGQAVSTEVTLSACNAPVHTVAPPASQVGTD